MGIVAAGISSNVDMHLEAWLLDDEVEGIGDRHSSVSPNVDMRLEAWLLSDDKVPNYHIEAFLLTPCLVFTHLLT